MNSPIMINTPQGHLSCHSIGEGLPILAIHGIISDHSFFQECSEILSNHYQFLSYDRRGYQDSTYTGSNYHQTAQAEDAACILKALAKEPAWIVGHSAGGLTALTLALHYPELVRGIILIETPVCLDPDLSAAIDDWFRKLASYRDAGKIKKVIPLFSQEIGGTAPAPSGGFDMKKIRRTFRNLDSFLVGELDSLHTEGFTLEQLQTLSCPCSVMITEHGSGSIFGRSCRDTANKLHWPILDIPGYHNVVQEDPETFCRELNKCIN